MSREKTTEKKQHDNLFGYPYKETSDALHGVRIFMTDFDRAIKIRESEKSLVIKTYGDFQFQREKLPKEEMKNIKRLFKIW